MKVLIAVDMQNDFIDGALGTPEAQAIVAPVEKKIREFDGLVILTRDTHQENYLKTQEGRNLPVEHCIQGSDGWQISPAVMEAARAQAQMQDEVHEDDSEEAAVELEFEPVIFDKPAFGSMELGTALAKCNEEEPVESVELVGLCTDICVISNAMIVKASLPEVPVFVDASCCAGVTPESHQRALAAMEACQIRILNV